MKPLKFLFDLIKGLAGQLLTVIGVMIVLGALFVRIWVMVPVGVVMAVAGFILLSKG